MEAVDRSMVFALRLARRRADGLVGCLRVWLWLDHETEGERMNVRKPCLYLALAVVLVVTAMLVGCPKKAQPPPDTAALPTPPGPEADQPEAVEPETAELPASDVVLTKELLDKWLACANDENVRKIAGGMDTEAKDDDLGSMKTAIEGMAASAELQEAVKAHGFESAEQWAAVTIKVMAGLLSAQLAQAEEQMAQMGDAPALDDAKAQMEKQIAEAKEAFGELSDDEQQVIDESLDDIKAAMEQDGGSGGPAGE